MAGGRFTAPMKQCAPLAAVQVALVLLALASGCEIASALSVSTEQGLADAIKTTSHTAKAPVVVTITQNILLTQSLPNIAGPIVIKGACSGGKCSVDGAGKYDIFQAYGQPPQCSVTIKHLILLNAGTSAVYSKCDLKLTHVHFRKNQRAVIVANGQGNWHIEDCLFEENSAGGAISVSSYGKGRVVRTAFRSNSNAEDGGAVYIFGRPTASYVFDRVTFDSNTAGKSGGGLFIAGTSATAPKVLISKCRFSKNVAKGGPGGALALTLALDARICHTSIASLGNSASGGEGNDVALLNGNYHPQMSVAFCPKKPAGLSLFVTPVPKPPIITEDCQGCALPS